MVTVDPRSPRTPASTTTRPTAAPGAPWRRVRWIGALSICASALCGCTLGTEAVADISTSAGGAGDRRASSAGALLPADGLPRGVPFAAGVPSVEEAEVVGEHSAHPLGRWRMLLLTARGTASEPPIVQAEKRLRSAGFVATGRLRGATASAAELWMSKDDITVRVRPTAGNPWLLGYDVTTVLASRQERRAECTTSYCER